MEILPGIEMIQETLWIKKEQILILSDIHIGYEDYLIQKGILLPKQQSLIITKKLENIFKIIKPKKIIINGDLKHEFGRVLKQEWNEVLKFIDFLNQNCQELIIIKGNHDTILGPITEKRNIFLKLEYQINNILILHGDKIKNKLDSKIKTIIIGHEHPALNLRDKSKIEKFKCFLIGKWKGKELIVMPSINPLIEGTDIIKEQLLSPYLKDIKEFRAFVIGKEEIFNFGKIKELK